MVSWLTLCWVSSLSSSWVSCFFCLTTTSRAYGRTRRGQGDTTDTTDTTWSFRRVSRGDTGMKRRVSETKARRSTIEVSYLYSYSSANSNQARPPLSDYNDPYYQKPSKGRSQPSSSTARSMQSTPVSRGQTRMDCQGRGPQGNLAQAGPVPQNYMPTQGVPSALPLQSGQPMVYR